MILYHGSTAYHVLCCIVHKLFYYRGLREYNNIKGYLIDTCLSCQDKYQEIVNEYGSIKPIGVNLD